MVAPTKDWTHAKRPRRDSSMDMHVDSSSELDVAQFDAGQSRLAQASNTEMEVAIAQLLNQRKDSQQRFIQGSPPKGVKRRRDDLDVGDGDDEGGRAGSPVNGRSLMAEFSQVQHPLQASIAERPTPELNKLISASRPVKRLRIRRRTVAHSRRLTRSRSSHYIPRPVSDDSYNRVLSLQVYAMDMVEVQDDVAIGVGADAPAGHRFSHLVRIVYVEPGEGEGKAGSMRTWYEDDSLASGAVKGVVRLDLYVSRLCDEDKGEGTSRESGGNLTFKLNASQIYAARDFLSLSLPCPIRPESPASYQDPLSSSPYTAHAHSALLNRAHNASVLIVGEEGLEREVVGVYACFAAYASGDGLVGMEETLGGVYYNVAAEEGKGRWERATMELWEGDVRAVGMLQAVAGRAGRPQDV